MKRILLLLVIATILTTTSLVSADTPVPQKIRIAAFNLYPTLFQAKDGTVQGFYVDFLSEIAKREGWTIEYVYGNWTDGISRIKSGEVDVLTNVALTSERTQFMDYGKVPLLTVWAELYAPNGASIDNIRDVQKKKIALMKGDFNAANFKNLVEKFGIQCTYVEYGNFEDVFKAIAAHQVDAGIVNNTFGTAKQSEYDLKSTGVIFNPFDIFFTVAKGKNSAILATLDRYLEEWRKNENSPYHQAREKWSHKSASTIRVVDPWLKKTAVVSVVLLCVTVGFVFLLRIQVRRKTAEIQKYADEIQVTNRQLAMEIEEHRKAEDELQESKSRFQAFYDLGLVGLAITSPEKGWLNINDCLCTMLGYSEAELRGMTWAQLTHPDDLAVDVEQFERVIKGEIDGYELDKRFLTRNGEIVFAKLVVRCVRKPDRTADFIVAMVQDITKSKQIENELRDAEWKFRALFNNGPIGVAYHRMIYDESGTPSDYLFIDANDNYLKLTGVDPRGKTVTQAFPGIEKDPFDWIGVFGKVAKTGETIHFLQHLESNNRWYDVVGYQYKPDHFVASFVEITDRKIAEESLRISEERFRSYVEHSPNAVFIVDDCGNYIDVNPAASSITGFTTDELLTMKINDLLPPESIEWAQSNFMQLLETGHSNGECAFRRKNGEIGYWSLSAVKLSASRYMAIVTDISDRKFNEDLLRDSEEKYRTLVQHLSSGVIVHATDTTIIFSNPMASTLLGLSKDQLRGKEAIDPSWCFIQENGEALAFEEYPVNKVLSSGKPVSNQVFGISHPGIPVPVWVQCNSYPVTKSDGELFQIVVTFTDITERKRDKETIEKRIIALTQPLESGTVSFEDLFNLEDVQRLQDEFAMATGVASIITYPDGTPLTAPSNFTRLCSEIIRKSDKGCANCFKSDAALGRYNPDGPNVQQCLSGGLWDAGAGIAVGGQHIANWLIGQVRDESQTEEKMAAYAREIGIDEVTFLSAFYEVPPMSRIHFEQVAQVLFTLANQLSTTAYQNIQQARFINERKIAEESLRTSEELHRSLSNELQTILNTSPVGICLLKNRKVVRANVAFESIFGYEAGASVNIDTVEFYSSKELYEETGKEAYQLLLQGGSYSKDVLMRKKDGTEFWCCISGHAVVPGNLEEGTIWILQDISERKQSEECLASMTQRLQLATSSAYLGIWDWNVKENTMIWDDRMFELYGLTREKFHNNIDAWMTGLHPEDKDKAIAESLAALNGEKEFDTEFRVLHPNGIVKYIRGKGLVLRGENGNAERMLGINYDITEVKQAEEEKRKLEFQLHQAQKMESVGRLAGGVAHDFNNMLGVIMGHAELGLIRLDPTNPVCADLKEISKTAERSADLTRQLLAFARKQTVTPKLIDLNDTITNMLKMLHRMIGEGIQLTWLPSPSQCQVKMDPSQIDQILVNLCVNARDAIADIGRITIETGTCSIDAEFCASNSEAMPGDYVRLIVSDDGHGMDTDTQNHIFEPFYTTKEMGKGTGLGLATVYGAVKQNNGFINIFSEPGKGTTFSIHLPSYAGDTASRLAAVDSPEVARGQETILLVEDEAAILNITAIMLEKQGYIVLKAETSGRAMEFARVHQGAIHLLMTDVIMPEMNGRELARNILSIRPDMKRLFMSGYTADVIAHHGVLDEGVHFIQKPYSLTNMASKVREVLDGN